MGDSQLSLYSKERRKNVISKVPELAKLTLHGIELLK